MSAIYIAGYDGSAAARAAVAFVRALAEATGAEPVAAAVYEGAPYIIGTDIGVMVSDELAERKRNAAERELAALADTIAVATEAVPADSAAAGLHRVAEERSAALLAVGTTHRGAIGRIVPGGVAEQLLHGTPCPVAVVPADAHAERPRLIAVAWDGRPQSDAALRAAVQLARRTGARVRLLCVYDPVRGHGDEYAIGRVEDERPAYERALLAAARSVPTGIETETRLEVGRPRDELVRACAEDVDLLVCGSRGYGPLHAVLAGSVSRYLADHAPCPVIIVPRAGVAAHNTGTPTAAGAAR